MRVISGSAGGCRLVCQPGIHTRPTADRTKEALFSILADFVPGSRFLDLFGGCGAIGIEALSRGADFCVFADNDARAVKCIKENLTKTRLADKAETLHMSAAGAIRYLCERKEYFDILYADPPYKSELFEESLQNLKKYNILRKHCVIVFETDNEYGLSIPGFRVDDTRKYGRARLYLGGMQ